MTDRPTRSTTAGRVYLDLRKLARDRNRPTDEYLQLYALEGVLARLPLSPHSERFVLKGGLLLAALDARRPTKDIDLAATGIPNEPDQVSQAIRELLEIELDDGLEFDTSAVTAQTIREDDDYSGVRVTAPCRLASARLNFHVDVNVGDPISPDPVAVSIPRILGGDPLRVIGYPIVMVLAEKIVTAIQRGAANTRWRDFADIAILTRLHAIKSTDLGKSLQAVAEHRLTPIQTLRSALETYADSAQPKWSAWRRRTRPESDLPELFSDLLEEVIAFADPRLRARSRSHPRRRVANRTLDDGNPQVHLDCPSRTSRFHPARCSPHHRP